MFFIINILLLRVFINTLGLKKVDMCDVLCYNDFCYSINKK